MTIREMLKKVEAFNEVSGHMDGGTGLFDRAYLKYDKGIGWFGGGDRGYEDYKSLAKSIRADYIPEVAKAILNYDGYEFGEIATLDIEEFPGYSCGRQTRIGFYVSYYK